jgi:sialic acid synthase SpsE
MRKISRMKIDAAVSITESQTKQLVEQIRSLEKIFGDGALDMSEAESGTSVFRRPSH